ncbi:MAG: acetyl-CoA carboxylase biotin carboxyl carrier protein subunit [Ignavibacteriaceae bacterium]|nr:acetyl-CoA carboxylase biotin carboxyl carrier protein subunit [Ignavibacteriaceae bacterium]
MSKEENLKKLEIDSTLYETKLTSKYLNRKPVPIKDPRKLTAFIPGIIRKIHVREGMKIKPGDNLLVLEAMKMENIITSSIEGRVKKIYVKEGETIMRNHILIEIE